MLANGGAINNINAALKSTRKSNIISVDILQLGGQVVDTQSGQPIGGAIVWLYEIAEETVEETADKEFISCPGLSTASTDEISLPTGDEFTSLTSATNPQVTDADGHFAWETTGGCLYVTVTAPGYLAATSTIVALTEEQVALQVGLAPATNFYLPLIQR